MELGREEREGAGMKKRRKERAASQQSRLPCYCLERNLCRRTGGRADTQRQKFKKSANAHIVQMLQPGRLHIDVRAHTRVHAHKGTSFLKKKDVDKSRCACAHRSVRMHRG